MLRNNLVLLVILSVCMIAMPIFAAAETDTDTDTETSASGIFGNTYSLRAVHKVSGYTTIGAGLLTGVTKSYPDLHCRAARGTASLGAFTVLTGLTAYGAPKISREALLSPRSLHPLMGITGMLSCAIAVYFAGHSVFSNHPGFGVAGAGLMTASAVILKWDVIGFMESQFRKWGNK